MNIMPIRHSLITNFVTWLIGISIAIAAPWGAAKAQTPGSGAALGAAAIAGRGRPGGKIR